MECIIINESFVLEEKNITSYINPSAVKFPVIVEIKTTYI